MQLWNRKETGYYPFGYITDLLLQKAHYTVRVITKFYVTFEEPFEVSYYVCWHGRKLLINVYFFCDWMVCELFDKWKSDDDVDDGDDDDGDDSGNDNGTDNDDCDNGNNNDDDDDADYKDNDI